MKITIEVACRIQLKILVMYIDRQVCMCVVVVVGDFRRVQESGPQAIKTDKGEKAIRFQCVPLYGTSLAFMLNIQLFSKSLPKKKSGGGVKNVDPSICLCWGGDPPFPPAHTLLMQMERHCSLRIYIVFSLFHVLSKMFKYGF